MLSYRWASLCRSRRIYITCCDRNPVSPPVASQWHLSYARVVYRALNIGRVFAQNKAGQFSSQTKNKRISNVAWSIFTRFAKLRSRLAYASTLSLSACFFPNISHALRNLKTVGLINLSPKTTFKWFMVSFWAPFNFSAQSCVFSTNIAFTNLSWSGGLMFLYAMYISSLRQNSAGSSSGVPWNGLGTLSSVILAQIICCCIKGCGTLSPIWYTCGAALSPGYWPPALGKTILPNSGAGGCGAAAWIWSGLLILWVCCLKVFFYKYFVSIQIFIIKERFF